MRNFLMVLACLTSVMFAHGALNQNLTGKHGKSKERGNGGGRDGRGVGGGYGGHVEDAVIGIGFDLGKFIGSLPRDINGKIYSNIPEKGDKVPTEVDGVYIDIEAIIHFIEEGKVQIAGNGDIYMGDGSSYSFYDGTLYLNATIWDQKILRGEFEEDLLRVLLIATGQSDCDPSVARQIAEKISAQRDTRPSGMLRDVGSALYY